MVAVDTRLVLHTMGQPEAAISVFHQSAERWAGIQGGRAMGGEMGLRLGSWVKTIAVRPGVLPQRRSSGHTHPVYASGHSVKKHGCEKGEIDRFIRRVEQPARQ